MPPQQRREEDHVDVTALREPLLSPPWSDDHSSATEDSSSRSSSSTTSPASQVSRNVPLTLTHTVFSFAGSSIWSNNVLGAYIYMLQHDNPQAVGYISGVMGLTQLLCSFPAGRFADSHRRDTLLRLASVTGMLAICATLYALWTQDSHNLVVALAVWGCTLGVGNTALWALFADSVPTGSRSLYFTKRSILTTLGTVAGPVTSLIMFMFLGDQWQVRSCAIVLAVGQFVSLPAVILFSFFNDDFAAADVHDNDDSDNDDDDDDNEGRQQANVIDVYQQHRQSLMVQAQAASDDEELAVQDGFCSPLISPRVYELNESRDDADDTDDDSDAARWSWLCKCCQFIQKRRIPSLVAAADLLGGVATGMSVRYFPIFFVDSLKLGPVLVQLIYVLTPLLQANMTNVGQLMSKRFGRLHVAVVHKWTGALLMYAMIAAHEMQAPLVLVIFLFICRTAIVNSVGALTRSTLMDHVPKTERGQWSALESVSVSGWSGSAVLGGLLVGQIGLHRLFLITASLQIVATFPLIALFRDDALEQSSTTTDERSAAAAIQGGGGGGAAETGIAST